MIKKILVLSIFIISGCAKSPTIADLSPEEIVAYKNISAFAKGQEGAPRQYTVITPVEGVDCKRNLYSSQDATKSQAYEAMLVLAAQKGASTIIDVECVDEGVSWSKNCWEAHICRGMAIK